MAWLCLFCAGILEIAWPIGFKYSKGFTKDPADDTHNDRIGC